MKIKSLTLAAALLLNLISAQPAFAAETVNLRMYAASNKTEGSDSEHLGVDDDGRLYFYSNLMAEWKVDATTAGEYTLTVKASCTAAKDGNAKFKVTANGKPAGEEITLKSESEADYTVKVTLKAGANTIGIAFTNDVYEEGGDDRNLYVHAASLKAAK